MKQQISHTKDRGWYHDKETGPIINSILKRKLTSLIKHKGDCVDNGEENIGCSDCPLSKQNNRIRGGRWDCKAKHHHRNNWVDVDDTIVYNEAVKMFTKLYGKDELFEALL